MSILELVALVSLVASGAFCWAVLRVDRKVPVSAPLEDQPADDEPAAAPVRLRAVG